MDFSKLEKNIVDLITEQQVKLGYLSETIRLYYPILSLNRLLGTDCTPEQMKEYLKEFSVAAEYRLGRIEISEAGGRFCFAIPPKGSDYVHRHMGQNEFLKEFIHMIGAHNCGVDEILQVFRKYSGCVHVEKVMNGEFDYLVYFEDGEPDDFRYCLTLESDHIIYHRYTREDYEDFGFLT